MTLHPQVARHGSTTIERIVIETQEPGVRIIDKTGPLANPADRDHCIQYMVAVPLIFGRLTAEDYEDEVARDPRIDALRAKMQVRENPTFTAGILRARQALHRQCRAGVLQGRHLEPARRSRLSHRPSQAPRRGHARAGEEVRGERRRALRSQADRGHQKDVCRPSGTRGALRERFHGADGERCLVAKKISPSTPGLWPIGLAEGPPRLEIVSYDPRYRRRKMIGPR